MNGTKWTSMFTFIVRWCYCRRHGVTSHGGARNWVTHIYVSNGGGVLRSFSFAFYNPFQPFYKLFLCVTHTRRYVVSIQLWLTTVSCRVTSSVRRNKTWPCADFRKSGREAYAGGVSATQSHWERTRHSHVCSPRFVYLDFINDVEYYGLQRIESSARLLLRPNHFPIKTHAVQRSLSQWLDAPSRAGQRMAHAAAVANAA